MEKRTNFSKKRDAILQAICSTKTHPTAEWVYQTLKPAYKDLSLATVYRNIGRFKKEGIINSVAVVNGQERFDGDLSDHVHFICEGCGKILDMEEIDSALLSQDKNDKLEEKHQITVTSRRLTLYGFCVDCHPQKNTRGKEE